MYILVTKGFFFKIAFPRLNSTHQVSAIAYVPTYQNPLYVKDADGYRPWYGRAELVTVWTSDMERAPGVSPTTLAIPVSVDEPLLCHVEGGRGEREH